MTDVVYAGLPALLLAAAAFWAPLRRRDQRSAGSTRVSVLLTWLAITFALHQRNVVTALDAVTPDLAKLLDNMALLNAAASVTALLVHVNYQPDEAHRRMRPRIRLLLLAHAVMAITFAATPADRVWSSPWTTSHWVQQPLTLHVYAVALVAYLSWALADTVAQTWKRAATAQRRSQRIGLRLSAVGYAFALVYATYKAVNDLAPLLIGKDLFPSQGPCTGPATPTRCLFTVTVPATSVLLITTGLTVPLLLWPLSTRLLRRWEERSLAELAPLWLALTSAMPDLTLHATQEETQDTTFLLHRRVAEICDGIMALRPHRSPAIRAAAAQAVADEDGMPLLEREAMVEAAVLADALRGHIDDRPQQEEPAPDAPTELAGTGGLRGETMWLRAVARAYSAGPVTEACTSSR